MGRCTVCGVYYCNCPTNGICDSCAAKMGMSQNAGVATVRVTASSCGVTTADIEKWRKRCECMLASNIGHNIGIGHSQVNTIYSYVMSAWNYRSDPCMFSQFIPQIQSFMQLLDINNLCSH